MRVKLLVIFIIFTILSVSLGLGILAYKTIYLQNTPEVLIKEYYSAISKQDYETMYGLLCQQSQKEMLKDDFIRRNSAIYEGIGISKLKIYFDENKKHKADSVKYHLSFDTVAGPVSAAYSARLVREKRVYRLIWNDNLIFPELGKSDKVRVMTEEARRGTIYDRSGKTLAGEGTAVSINIVPGKCSEDSTERLAELTGLPENTIGKKLGASWVKEDSLVPIQIRKKITDLVRLSPISDTEDLHEYELQKKISALDGVEVRDIEVREYPLNKAAAHLVGYVQEVTAEDLEKHEGEGYSSSDTIGRTGMESLYEERLRGKSGCSIVIVSEDGDIEEVIAEKDEEDGEDIHLTIDSRLQQILNDEYQDIPGCSVAINPYTGEVLSLVSTPSFDNNQFILGMESGTWDALNNDETNPLYNRFRQAWCPGSTFKPVTGAIALEEGSVSPDQEYDSEGLRWRKDVSWGSYYIKTLHEYQPVNLRNALIYSDNIFFAKTALGIGKQAMEDHLLELGFRKQIPFPIIMKPSEFSGKEHISSEIQLADSGYGQGDMLINPLHLAMVYSAFLNQGDIIKPYLEYKKEPNPEIWIQRVFSEETASIILDDLTKVIEDPHGTGHGAYMRDISLAGKTGTAELKATKDDSSGTEIGWFAVMTTDPAVDHPILIISMVENVKNLGGSGYVVEKTRHVLDQYLNMDQDD